MLHEEKSSIQIENDQLQEKLQQSENFEDPSSPISIRHTQMLVQIEALQEETYRYLSFISSEKDLRFKCFYACL